MSRGSAARRLLHGALTAVAVSAATLGAAADAVSFYGLNFPDQLDGAQVGETHDFESTDPGLGYGVRYHKPGWTMDIYVYDLGRSTIPSDLSSKSVKAQLAQARGDIFHLEKRGTYSQVKRTGSHTLKDHDGHARFLCEDFSYVDSALGKVDSFLCLTSWQSKFVKFRLTTAHGPDTAGDARRFMNAWMPVLWPEGQTH